MSKYMCSFVILSFFVLSCNKNATGPQDSQGAQAQTSAAYTSLENQLSLWVNGSFTTPASYDRLDFKTANTLYKQAIALDPNNTEAHFGAALTEILSAYADTQVNNSIKQWASAVKDGEILSAVFNGGFPSSANQLRAPLVVAAQNALHMHKMALTNAPLISQVQAVIRDRLLPRVVYALERLARVEQDSTFRFRISGKMQGDPNLSSVYLYVTEVYMIDAVWQGIRFLLEDFLVYRFDLPDYSQTSLVNALSQSNADFYVLASDGTTRAHNAKAALDAMFARIQTGLGTLARISGNKSDAVIKLSGTGFSPTEISSLQSSMQQARNALTTPLSVDLTNADSQGNNYTIQVYLGPLFDNPVKNPKTAFFPPYTVSASGPNGVNMQFTATTYADFNFPDPTFGGLFPGMTNSVLKRILYIDEEYGYTLEGYFYVENLYPTPIGTVKLQTATKTYTTTSDQWGNFRIVITDATNVPYQLFVNIGSGDIEIAGSSPLTIRAKTHDWFSITIPQQPQNLAAAVLTNPKRVQLTWTPASWSMVVVQRGVGIGSIPVNFDSAYGYYGIYVDNAVSTGTTYTYRIKTASVTQFYGLTPKYPSYSSVVTITP